MRNRDDLPDPDDVPEIGAEMLHRKRENFEQHMRLFPPVTAVLIAACVAAFGAELANGALESEDAIVRAGALSPQKVQDGEVWRLGSAVFLHGSVEHLLGNMVMLYIFGMACEHAFGRGQYLGLYAAAGLAGSLASLAGGHTSVGASGAIFGVSGAAMVFFARFGKLFKFQNQQVGWVIPLWAAYQVWLGVNLPQVDNWAHVGGFVGGALVALILERRAGAGGTGDDYTRPVPAAALGFGLLCLGGTAVGWAAHLAG